MYQSIYMESLRYWISFMVNIMIWLFAFRLFDAYFSKYNYTVDETIKVSLSGFIFFCLLSNTDYIKFDNL